MPTGPFSNLTRRVTGRNKRDGADDTMSIYSNAYAKNALYTKDGHLNADSELQVIHDSLITADLSDEEDERRFNQELYRSAVVQSKQNPLYQQRADSAANAALKTQLCEQQLLKQVHTLQEGWAQEAASEQRRKSRRRANRQYVTNEQDEYTAIHSSALPRMTIDTSDLHSTYSKKSHRKKQSADDQYFSFYDDYLREVERRRRFAEEQERRKLRWNVYDSDEDGEDDNDDFKVLEPFKEENFDFPSAPALQPPQPPPLSYSPSSDTSTSSIVPTTHTHSIYSNASHANSSTRSLLHEDLTHSTSHSPAQAHSPAHTHAHTIHSTTHDDDHSDLFSFREPYADPEDDDSSTALGQGGDLLPPGHFASAAPPASLFAQHLPTGTTLAPASSSTHSLHSNDQPTVERDLPPQIHATQPAEDGDEVVRALELQAASFNAKNSSSSSCSFYSSSPSSTSTFHTAVSQDPSSSSSSVVFKRSTSSHYAPSRMTADTKVSAFSAKAIYDRFASKKKGSAASSHGPSKVSPSAAVASQPPITNVPPLPPATGGSGAPVHVKTNNNHGQPKLHSPPLSFHNHPVPSSFNSGASSVGSPPKKPVPASAAVHHSKAQHHSGGGSGGQTTRGYPRSVSTASSQSTITPMPSAAARPMPHYVYPNSIYSSTGGGGGSSQASTLTRQSYASRRGEVHVAIPLNAAAAQRPARPQQSNYNQSGQMQRQMMMSSPTTTTTTSAAQKAAAEAEVDYGVQMYESWLATKQLVQGWATSKVSLCVLIIYFLVHFF